MKALIRIIKGIIIFFISSTLIITILYRYINPPLTPLMVIRVMQQISKGKEILLKKQWVNIKDISPNMISGVIAAEDQLFMTHQGFDFKAIGKAYDNNQKRNRMKGGSTISQQTAKNVFLWTSRTWLRKGLEAYFTVMIELLWGKERIMEVYLNVIETGDGIYGVEAASRKYFNKGSKHLTSREAALISASLPNPRRYKASHPSNYLLKRQAWILGQMSQTARIKF